MRLPLSLSILISLALASTAGCLPSFAALRSDSTAVFFHQGKSDIDPEYRLNGGSVDLAVEQLSEILGDSLKHLKGVRLSGAASPEGSVAINRRLSDKRAERLQACFSFLYDFPDSITSVTFKGRDWRGLRRLVEEDEAVPERKKVMEVLDEIIISTPEGEEPEHSGNLARLREACGKATYSYLYENLFPQLRKSEITFDYWEVMPIYAGRPELSVQVATLLPPYMASLGKAKACKPFYMSLKTNLLYDLAAVPAVGAEFYLGKNLSIAANWEYGWWKTDRLHRYWRAYGGDLGLRWWFGKAAHDKPLTGHHVGIYAGVLTYDFEWGGTGYMGGRPGHTLWDRCMKVAGVEYGYSLPIGRRLNLDFTLGIGYMGGKYVKYHPDENLYVWDSTHQLHWFGPTKAEVSLVWLIGCGNENQKGGRR